MRTRKPIAAGAAAALCLLAAGPVASAGADTTQPAATTPPALTFVPPAVGPIRVDIAPIVINGQVVNSGLHVLMPGVTLPPIRWTIAWPPVT
jgi:hypothetical protein